MSKIGAYEPEDKHKNYLLPTAKLSRNHAFKEKVWTLQEQISQKLKKIAEFLEDLYPKLTDDFSSNTKAVIEKNVEKLLEHLSLMQNGFENSPSTFNTNNLKINQNCITEMKSVCDSLQTVRSYEFESKKLGKIKHELKGLERLIQPTSIEKSLKKTPAKTATKKAPAKKGRTPVKAKKTKVQPKVSAKKKSASSKKEKPPTKLLTPAKKKQKKSAAPVRKTKQAAKKVAIPKTKQPAVRKKPLAKSKPKMMMK